MWPYSIRPSRLSRFSSILLDSGVALAALAVYLLTLAATITWRNQGADSGDLATAAWTLGVPHPPGYPLYTLLAALFARLPGIDPAHGVALLSAVAAAGAVGLLVRTLRAVAAPDANDRLAAGIAAAVALQFAFSPLLWSQATIAEVYALNLFFVSLVLWSVLSPTPVARQRLYVGALAFGLGLAHHLSMLLFLPALMIALRGMGVSKKGWAAACLLALAPLSLYLYLPLRASADPSVNWGDPRTLDNFIWVVTAAPYHGYWFSLSPGDLLARVAFVTRLAFEQFGPWGIALALWGAARMLDRARILALSLLVTLALITVGTILYGSRDSFVYMLPAFAVVTLWVALGLTDVVSRLFRFRKADAMRDRISGAGTNRTAWPAASLALAILVFLPAFNLAVNFKTLDLHRDREAYDYAAGVLAAVPDDALVIADGDDHLFALWYLRYVVQGNRSHVLVVSAELLQFQWYAGEIARRTIWNSAAILAPGPALQRQQQLINAAFAAGHSVYLTGSDPDLLAGYIYRREGVLVKIIAIR